MKYDSRTVKQWAGTSQWRAWRADLARYRADGYNGFLSETFWPLTVYRMERSIRVSPRRRWLLPLAIPVRIARKLLTIVLHIHLHPDADIGPGFLIYHVGPIRVTAWTKIGADCSIHHTVTFGIGARPGAPRVGDHVAIGTHCCLLGGIRVGDNTKIGAGAVVVDDLPADVTAVGVPAKPVLRDVRVKPAGAGADRNLARVE